MTRKFCLMTTGRAGSTALMSALEAYPDILVPNKQVPCPDNELIHPDYMSGYLDYYFRQCGQRIDGAPALIESFFKGASGYAYAGFKSMPDRHPDFDAFIAHSDIQFITLQRQDIPSTVASFITAFDKGGWRRQGRHQPHRWCFDRSHYGRARDHLRYLHACFQQMGQIPNAIQISYEALCSPGFSNPALNDFFGRSIIIEDPRPPLSGEEYVANWDAFRVFVDSEYAAIAGSSLPKNA